MVKKRASHSERQFADFLPAMYFPVQITFIIYVLVFIIAKVLHCIDVSNDTVAVTIAATTNMPMDVVNNASDSNGNVTQSSVVTNQTTATVESTTPLPDADNVMQMCNQSFPTLKGTVC